MIRWLLARIVGAESIYPVAAARSVDGAVREYAIEFAPQPHRGERRG